VVEHVTKKQNDTMVELVK